MRKGFTLLELIIVIIIIGILATMGFIQYSATVEKARGAEARATIGALRTQAMAKGYQFGTTTTLTIGTGGGDSVINVGMVAGTCTGAGFFSYGVDSACTGNTCTFTATRCTSGGKSPDGPAAYTLTLAHTTSSDGWTSTYGY